MGVPIETSEFSYLPTQADALGVNVPAVQRVSLPLGDGRTVSALRFGTEPPQVTFLHGAGLNAHTWDTTVLLLGLPALVIDLAGHGDSSWREDATYAPRLLAEDVIEALSAWTSTPQVLVGQSLGGLTAAAVASIRPELVRELIIVDITPGVDSSAGPAVLRAFYAGPTDFDSRETLVDKAIEFGFGGEREDTARGVFFNTRVREDGRVEWKHHFAHLAAQTLDADTQSAMVRSYTPATGWEDLTGVHSPITLVRGLRGFVTEADADEFQLHVPAAKVIALDATHNVQETAPGELAALIAQK